MLILDANILLGAFADADSVQRHLATWLTARVDGPEQVGLSDVVLSAVIRVSTNSRVYTPPATPDEAVVFCDHLRAASATQMVVPGRRHWELFTGLIREHLLRANDITDAYLAALALENGATFVTRDRGFARFSGLRLLDPLQA